MLRKVLFLVLLGVSSVSAGNVTLYLEDYCGKISPIEVADTVTIRLARDGHQAERSCSAQLSLNSRPDVQLFVSFSEFRLRPADDPRVCLQNFLKIGGLAGENQDHRVCDRPPLETLNHFLFSPENFLDKHFYYFRTTPLEKNDSIVLTVSAVAFADVNGSCPLLARENNAVNDFRCESDDLCIPNFLRCDRIPNCRDGSDELDCIGTTTTESTTSSASTVASLSPNKEIARGGDRKSGGSSKTPHIIIGTVGGVVIIVLVAVIALFLVRRNKRRYHNVTTRHVPETTTGTTEGEEINTALREPEASSV